MVYFYLSIGLIEVGSSFYIKFQIYNKFVRLSVVETYLSSQNVLDCARTDKTNDFEILNIR